MNPLLLLLIITAAPVNFIDLQERNEASLAVSTMYSMFDADNPVPVDPITGHQDQSWYPTIYTHGRSMLLFDKWINFDE